MGRSMEKEESWSRPTSQLEQQSNGRILSQAATSFDNNNSGARASSAGPASPLIHGGLAVLEHAVESYKTTTTTTTTTAEAVIPSSSSSSSSSSSLWNQALLPAKPPRSVAIVRHLQPQQQHGKGNAPPVRENHPPKNQVDIRPPPLPRWTTAMRSAASPKEAVAFPAPTTVNTIQAAGTRDGRSSAPLVPPELGAGVAMVVGGIPSPRAPASATDARNQKEDPDQREVRGALVVAEIGSFEILPRSLSPPAGRKKKQRLLTRERTEQERVVEVLQADEEANGTNQLAKVTVTGEVVKNADIIVEKGLVESGESVEASNALSSSQPTSSPWEKQLPSSRKKLQLHPPDFDINEAKHGGGKIRRRYTIDFKIKAAKYALSKDANGKAKGGTVGPRYVAAKLGIPEAQSVREWTNRLPDMERALAQAKMRGGARGSQHVRSKMSVSLGRMPVTHSIEAQLLRFIQESEAKAGQGISVSSRLVKDKAQELLPGVFGRPPPRENLVAVRQHEGKISSWCHRFLKRHGVILSVCETPLKWGKGGGGMAVVAPSRPASDENGTGAGSSRGGGVATSSPVQNQKLSSVVTGPAVAPSLCESAVSTTISKNMNATAGAPPGAGASPATAIYAGVTSQAVMPFGYSGVFQALPPSQAHHIAWQVPPLGSTSAAL